MRLLISIFITAYFAGCGTFSEIGPLGEGNDTEGDNTSDTGQNCASQSYSDCVEGSVYWFDACGKQEALKSHCLGKSKCEIVSATEAECRCDVGGIGIDTECQACEFHEDCPGPVGVCSHEGTCTCWSDGTNPTGSCSSHEDCPNEDFLCVKDNGEFSYTQPDDDHFVCLRKCTYNGSDVLVFCASRTTIDGDTHRIWTPQLTTCLGFRNHTDHKSCSSDSDCAVFGGSFTEAFCGRDDICTYMCGTLVDRCLEDEICDTDDGWCYSTT